MRGFVLLGVHMKDIQFKKISNHTGNHEEITCVLGGSITYAATCGSKEIQKKYERDNQIFPLQFNDWILDVDGVIFVLSDQQYQAFQSLLEPKKDLGVLIGNAVRLVIRNEIRQGGGLLSNEQP